MRKAQQIRASRRRTHMTRSAYRGVVRGGVGLLDGQTPLTEGTEVLVAPVAGVPGSPAAILAAVENAPKVAPEWVDELEQLIAEGRRPPASPVGFLDEPGRQE